MSGEGDMSDPTAERSAEHIWSTSLCDNSPSHERVRRGRPGGPVEGTSSGTAMSIFCRNSPAPRARRAVGSTSRRVVRVLAEIIAPYISPVHEPCHGLGGMFVSSERFVEAHRGRIGDLSIYAQESNYTPGGGRI